MRKRQNGIKVKYIVSALLVLLISLITIIFGGGVSVAYAAAVDYSGVMQDLQKDENFKPEDYPDNPQDYSLQVIQIAESTDKKLFLYVYNPCGVTRPLIATCVNMSLTQSVDNTRLYNLTYVSSNGVFGKYLVNGVTVSEETERYYNITSIYRKWIKGIDEESGDDNIKNEVAFAVGKCYKAFFENGIVKYEFLVDKVVVIKPEQKYLGLLRYPNGLYWYSSKTDAHYLAFDCDYSISDIYSADISFVINDVINGNLQDKKENKEITILQSDNSSSVVVGLFFEKYERSRIVKASDFILQEDLNQEVKQNIADKQWVFRFYETEYATLGGVAGGVTSSKAVSSVSVLRLRFKSNGEIYNLGVVDGKGTGSGNPDNIPKTMGFLAYIWHCIVAFFTGTATTIEIIVAIVVLFICVPFVPVLITILSLTFPAFREVMKKIFKGIWWIISAPFRFIAWIIRKIKGGE